MAASARTAARGLPTIRAPLTYATPRRRCRRSCPGDPGGRPGDRAAAAAHRGVPQQDRPSPRAGQDRRPRGAGQLRRPARAAPAAAARAPAPPGRGGSRQVRPRAKGPATPAWSWPPPDRATRPRTPPSPVSRRAGRPGPDGSRSARPMPRPPIRAPAAAVTGLLHAGARRVLVATYLLAPGFFADRIRDAVLAAGAAAVSPVARRGGRGGRRDAGPVPGGGNATADCRVKLGKTPIVPREYPRTPRPLITIR